MSPIHPLHRPSKSRHNKTWGFESVLPYAAMRELHSMSLQEREPSMGVAARSESNPSTSSGTVVAGHNSNGLESCCKTAGPFCNGQGWQYFALPPFQCYGQEEALRRCNCCYPLKPAISSVCHTMHPWQPLPSKFKGCRFTPLNIKGEVSDIP